MVLYLGDVNPLYCVDCSKKVPSYKMDSNECSRDLKLYRIQSYINSGILTCVCSALTKDGIHSEKSWGSFCCMWEMAAVLCIT